MFFLNINYDINIMCHLSCYTSHVNIGIIMCSKVMPVCCGLQLLRYFLCANVFPKNNSRVLYNTECTWCSDDTTPGGLPRNWSTASGLVDSPSMAVLQRNSSDNALDDHQRDVETAVIVKSTSAVQFSVGDDVKANNNAKSETVATTEENDVKCNYFEHIIIFNVCFCPCFFLYNVYGCSTVFRVNHNMTVYFRFITKMSQNTRVYIIIYV